MLLLAEFVHAILEVVAEIFVAVLSRLFGSGDDLSGKLRTPATWIVYFYRFTILIALALILLAGVAWIRDQGWWPFN